MRGSISTRARLAGRACAGFSIIEMGVVLFILGILIGAVIRPLVANSDSRVLDETQRVLDEAREALLGYVVANGYFPCPADGASGGQEAAGTDHNSGSCPAWHGFLPAAALGLRTIDPQGYAVGGLREPQHRIRYAVSNQPIVGIANPFTKRLGMRQVGPQLLDAEAQFFVCGSGAGVTPGTDCGTAVVLTSSAIAVIWSIGGNALSGGTSIDEAENPNANGGSADRIFVSRSRSVVSGSEYDDVLIWVTPGVVVNRLLASGFF